MHTITALIQYIIWQAGTVQRTQLHLIINGIQDNCNKEVTILLVQSNSGHCHTYTDYNIPWNKVTNTIMDWSIPVHVHASTVHVHVL